MEAQVLAKFRNFINTENQEKETIIVFTKKRNSCVKSENKGKVEQKDHNLSKESENSENI